MCFQGFSVWTCGHRSVDEHECAEAQELELPFFQKVQCPQYTTAHIDLPHACGLGKFYCSQDVHAGYLNHVFRARAEMVKEQFLLDDSVARVFMPRRDKIQARMKSLGISDRAAIQRFTTEDPEAVALALAAEQIRAKKQHLETHKAHADSVMYYSQQHYMLVAHAAQTTGHLTGLGRTVKIQLPARLLNFPAPAQLTFNAPIPPVASAAERLKNITVPATAAADDSNITVRQRPVSSNMNPGPTPTAVSTVRSSVEANQGERPRKRGRPLKQTREESMEDQPGPAVRRSARTKNVKINYAERPDLSSPEHSPSRSDMSSFSPAKSNASASPGTASPARRPVTRAGQTSSATRGPASSLVDMIKKFKQGDVASLQKAALNLIPGGTAEGPGNSAGAGNSNTATSFGNENSMPFVTPSRNWLINQGNADPTQTPDSQHNTAPYGLHTGFTPTANTVLGRIQNNSANSPLTIQPIQINTPEMVRDPRKRVLSQSSPAQPSSKKMRLSLPGESGVPVFQAMKGKSRAVTSSPGNMRRDSPQAPVTPPEMMDDPFVSNPDQSPNDSPGDDFEDLEDGDYIDE